MIENSIIPLMESFLLILNKMMVIVTMKIL